MTCQKITFPEKYIILDNEGTICSISTLLPFFDYFVRTLKQYLDEYWEDSELQMLIGMLKKQYLDDIADEVPGLVPIVEGADEKESIYNNIMWHLKLSRKSTAIKIMRLLQHLVWRHGFQSNAGLKFEIFEDVERALRLWKECNRNIYIYSSGSSESQKMFFENNSNGDILQFLSGSFDLEMGLKTESSSYSNIVSKLGCSARDVLFITDMVAEADAASKAGCRALMCIRPGNAPISEEDRSRFTCIKSFDEVIPDSTV